MFIAQNTRGKIRGKEEIAPPNKFDDTNCNTVKQCNISAISLGTNVENHV